MVKGRIYTVQSSDIPNLYHVGLYNALGKKMKIRKDDYYKLIIEGNDKKRVPHHIDTTTGKLYEYVPNSDVNRYRSNYIEILPDLTLAEQGNIKPITHDQVEIKKEIGNIVNSFKEKELTNKLVKEDNKELRNLRLERTGETIENALTKPLEPFTRGIDKLTENVDKLGSSPFFIVALVLGGVVAAKILL